MPKVVKDVCAAVLAVLGACAFAPSALAQGDAEDELSRWVPALGFVVGVAANSVEGDLWTTDVLGPRVTPPPLTETRLIAGSPASDETVMVIPSFGASLELMSPGWKRIPGSPRAFGRVDLSFAFGPQYNVPSLGDPGEFSVSGSQFAVTEVRVLGQGANTTVETEPFVLAAGGGIAFTLEADGRAIRLKPSVEYLRHEMRVSGILRRAVQVSTPSTGLSGFREVTLSATDTQIYHWVGPGIEADFDATRAGDFIFSPYVSLKAWVVIDNSSLVVQDSNQFDETAVWYARPNRWAFGGTVGVRVRWAPE